MIVKEVNYIIKTQIKSKKRDVLLFLEELNKVLSSPTFNLSRDFIFIRSPKEEAQFSTRYTLLDLNYNSKDVLDKLKELKLEDYSETLFDLVDENPPLLYVFGKTINDKKIYIKLKIRDESKKVLCLSFHYAKFEMIHPYK